MAEEEKKEAKSEQPKDTGKQEKPKVDLNFTDAEIAEGKGVAWLSYLGILILIPWLTKKENKFVMAQVRQGLIMIIFFFAISIIAACPVVGWIVSVICWLAGLICSLIALINSISGKYWRIPVLGKFAEDWFAKI